MVLKIDLWRLGTLVRRFLSLGIGFSLKNSEPFNVGLLLS
ncbi:unnamed protein product [Linum tenue]|uniref:Uncharacterized protein n=1 Tax=Linum tenue TaxID=586396 RepID=A0AAV0RSC1_9ROSI|nr:unnamed protein product [Linum tenue]